MFPSMLLMPLVLIQATVGDPTALLDHILDNYDKRIRPFTDANRPVVVEMTLVLAILTELVRFRLSFTLRTHAILARESAGRLLRHISRAGKHLGVNSWLYWSYKRSCLLFRNGTNRVWRGTHICLAV